MKISVIIPVHNAERYLVKCLDSLAHQSVKELEMILIDDGSTDGSRDLLGKFATVSGNVKMLVQRNSGQGAARNRGLEQASGEYVYFVDADDELGNPDILSQLADEMDREKLDVLFFDAETRIDAGVEVSEEVIRPEAYIRRGNYSAVYTGPELLARFLRKNEFCVVPYLMMLRRSFIEECRLRFPEARLFYEDNIFTTRVMLAAKRASHRPWRGYVRKVHSGSTMTSAVSERHINGYRACLEDVRTLLGREDLDCRTKLMLHEREMVYLRQLHLLEGSPRPFCERIYGWYLVFRCRDFGYLVKRAFRKMFCR